MANNQNRRSALKNMIAGTVALGATGVLSSLAKAEGRKENKEMALKGNINHSVCPWCYQGISLDELCVFAKKIGIKGIDLLGPKDWPTVKKHGLDSPMCNGAEINLTDGFAEPKFHATLQKNYSEMIPKVAAAGYTNLICFSGSRRGMDNETGWKNCVEGLKQILPLAEKNGITIQMELLNSKLNHKDYMCDRTPWGVELCKRLGSPNFKLLYDIYHMQIDEGDVIQTIRDNHDYIGHYHTAGVPGRHEIDDTQELYYPAIMKAIKDTGYTGYVAHEFNAKNQDKIAALKDAVKICDI